MIPAAGGDIAIHHESVFKSVKTKSSKFIQSKFVHIKERKDYTLLLFLGFSGRFSQSSVQIPTRFRVDRKRKKEIAKRQKTLQMNQRPLVLSSSLTLVID